MTLSDALGNALDRWAVAEGSRPATLAAFLLEQSIREAIDEGKVPPEPEPDRHYESFEELLKGNMSDLVTSAKFPNGRLRELMEGKKPNEVEVLRIALICQLTEEYVLSLLDR